VHRLHLFGTVMQFRAAFADEAPQVRSKVALELTDVHRLHLFNPAMQFRTVIADVAPQADEGISF